MRVVERVVVVTVGVMAAVEKEAARAAVVRAGARGAAVRVVERVVVVTVGVMGAVEKKVVAVEGKARAEGKAAVLRAVVVKVAVVKKAATAAAGSISMEHQQSIGTHWFRPCRSLASRQG